MTDETTYDCVLCAVYRPAGKPRTPSSLPACDPCRIRLRDDLTGIPVGYAALPDGLEPGRSGQQGGSRAFGSRLPLSLNPLDLLGPGTMELSGLGGSQVGSPPPLVVLHWWTLDWCTYVHQDPPYPAMPDVVTWLGDHLDWAVNEHPAIDDFAQDVSRISRTIDAVAQAGQSKGVPFGQCPRWRDAAKTERCGTWLFLTDTYADQVSCTRCDTKWEKKTGGWIRLRAAQLVMEEEMGVVEQGPIWSSDTDRWPLQVLHPDDDGIPVGVPLLITKRFSDDDALALASALVEAVEESRARRRARESQEAA